MTAIIAALVLGLYITTLATGLTAEQELELKRIEAEAVVKMLPLTKCLE